MQILFDKEVAKNFSYFLKEGDVFYKKIAKGLSSFVIEKLLRFSALFL